MAAAPPVGRAISRVAAKAADRFSAERLPSDGAAALRGQASGSAQDVIDRLKASLDRAYATADDKHRALLLEAAAATEDLEEALSETQAKVAHLAHLENRVLDVQGEYADLVDEVEFLKSELALDSDPCYEQSYNASDLQQQPERDQGGLFGRKGLLNLAVWLMLCVLVVASWAWRRSWVIFMVLGCAVAKLWRRGWLPTLWP